MQFQRRLAGIILSSILPASAAFAAGAVAPEPVQVAFSQSEPVPVDVRGHENREFPLVVDFAGILHIEGGMSAIAVGNPAIADASLADHRTVILTGRTAGTTNLIALDDGGRILANVMVRVSSQKPGTVTVRRGTQIQAYACTSALCEGSTSETVSPAIPQVSGNGG